jgi:hypothetical protein
LVYRELGPGRLSGQIRKDQHRLRGASFRRHPEDG